MLDFVSLGILIPVAAVVLFVIILLYIHTFKQPFLHIK